MEVELEVIQKRMVVSVMGSVSDLLVRKRGGVWGGKRRGEGGVERGLDCQSTDKGYSVSVRLPSSIVESVSPVCPCLLSYSMGLTTARVRNLGWVGVCTTTHSDT